MAHRKIPGTISSFEMSLFQNNLSTGQGGKMPLPPAQEKF